MTKSFIKKIGYLFILFFIVNCNNFDPLMNMSLDQLEVHLEEIKEKRNQDPSNENLLEEYLITKYLLDPNSKIPEDIFVNTESLRERLNFLHNISDVNNDTSKTGVEVDICRCLTEPGTTEWFKKTREKCDKLISKEIGVNDWKKVNFSKNPILNSRWQSLKISCGN